MDLLLNRGVVIALAVLGAVLSFLASFLELRGYVSPKAGRVINWTGYGCMGASMLLFALAGLLG